MVVGITNIENVLYFTLFVTGDKFYSPLGGIACSVFSRSQEEIEEVALGLGPTVSRNNGVMTDCLTF